MNVSKIILPLFLTWALNPAEGYSKQGPKPGTPVEYEVYDALIENMFVQNKPSDAPAYNRIAITDQTVIGYEQGSESVSEFHNLLKKELMVSDEAFDDFKAQGKITAPLDDRFSLSMPHIMLSEKTLDTFPKGEKFWKTFFKRFPKTEGIINLSKVGFNRDKTNAIVCIQTTSCDGCGESFLATLEKKGKWNVVKIFSMWVDG